MVVVALIPPKFNHFLLKHFGNSENLKKNHPQLFKLHCSVTNHNDYITSTGGGNIRNTSVTDTCIIFGLVNLI